ncbi:hypothetical protein [Armatimonas rosea]|uniref:VRR-NUC domain-containing protein n=1 Tax=Armatimonas rosea TaxID=685828 RepID=A0A7W9SUZ2_ARMRO|nr:hypothetical protein [Armatimonas rosea]MBB6053330.1 hypothetical protein [Armatimonas rosea]
MPELIEGATYRFIGDSAAYRGRTGVLSGVRRQGRHWFGSLSNHAEWMKAGLPPQIEVMDTELELVSAPKAKPAASVPASVAFDGMEADLVALIEFAAQERGFEVAKVGQFRADGSGTTVGYPDMSFRRPSWPRGLVCLIEVKTKAGVLSPEQQKLNDQGWSFVARSTDEALVLLDIFERSFGGKL